MTSIMRKAFKGFLVGLGFLFIALGTIGIVLPILPTTPFYLLALGCLAKGSKRFNLWFTGTKLYKKHLDGFVQSRQMTFNTKVSILLPVTIMLSVAIIAVPVLPMRILLVTLLAGKYYYFIFKIQTVRRSNNL